MNTMTGDMGIKQVQDDYQRLMKTNRPKTTKVKNFTAKLNF